LKNRRATTYHLLNGGKRKQLAEFGAVVVDQHLVIDENIVSCTSPAYAIEVAFALLEKLSSVKNCIAVKEAMGFL
jgi:4-methyl-5(b-hydroxyethyl)-thiazole monophosphate biosynthesis